MLDGFYSAEHAREAYGVVVDLEAETVDAAATEAPAGAHERLTLPKAAGNRRPSLASDPDSTRWPPATGRRASAQSTKGLSR